MRLVPIVALLGWHVVALVLGLFRGQNVLWEFIMVLCVVILLADDLIKRDKKYDTK